MAQKAIATLERARDVLIERRRAAAVRLATAKSSRQVDIADEIATIQDALDGVEEAIEHERGRTKPEGILDR